MFSRKLTGGSIYPEVFKLSVKNFSSGNIISECIVKRGDWSETSNLSWIFTWSTVCVEETGFEQLITDLSNETGHPPWYNYTVRGQN